MRSAGPLKDDVSPALARRVDGICNRFEDAWAAGQRPKIEDYLEDLSAAELPLVLRELVQLEAYYRRAAGETPDLEEYRSRFPVLPAEIDLDTVHSVRSPAPDTPAEGLAAGPDSVQGAASWPRITGYEILGSLGRGGMGVVYQARQLQLNRLVALKMILAGDHAGPEELVRFRREAEAVARLDHPNIVHIYEVGDWEGRPYLALEYVDGGSLAHEINGTPQPAREAARLVEVLARAVDHAHQRGILHRDLKPANILLQIGERRAREEQASTDSDRIGNLESAVPKIADFGLAKQLDEASLRSGPGHTQSGMLLGTPSYMSPEQAAGHTQSVGPSTDVYALGAVLYELLTGRPPHRAATVLSTLEQVCSQEPIPPSRFHLNLPRDLEIICLTCLRKEPSKRYASALALAEDLRRFLANEPITARPTPVWERGLKWARRRPAVAAMLAVSSLALGLLLTTLLVSNWRIGQEKARAETHFQLAREAVDEYITRVSQEPRLRAQDLDDFRKQLLQSAVVFYEKLVQHSGGDPKAEAERGRAYERLGFITQEIASQSESLDLYQRARAIFEDLVRAYPAVPEYQQELATTHNDLGNLYSAAGKLPDAEAAYDKALEIRERLANAHPSPATQKAVAISRNSLSNVYRATGRLKQAETALHDAVVVQEKLVRENPGVSEYEYKLASYYNNTGNLYGATGRLDPAEDAYRKAIAIRERLGSDPENRYELLKTQINLGTVHLGRGRLKDAEASFRKAVEISNQLTNEHPSVTEYRRQLAATNNSIGIFYATTGRFDKAEEAFRKILTIREGLPPGIENRQALATTHNNLGNIFLLSGRLQQAEAAYHKALDIRAQLASENPTVIGYRQEWAVSNLSIGDVYRRLGRVDQAETTLRKAQDIYAQLVAAQPSVPEYQHQLAIATSDLGKLFQATDRLDQAEGCYQKALATLEPLGNKLARATDLALDLGTDHALLGDVLQQTGRIQAADDQYTKAIRILEPLFQRNRAEVQTREALRSAYRGRADVLHHLARYAESLPEWDRALQLAEGPDRDVLQAARLRTRAHLVAHAEITPEAQALAAKKDISADALYALAGVYALSSAAARNDVQQAADNRDELAEKYAACAVELLARARAAEYFKVSSHRKRFGEDPELDCLRSRADFQQMLSQVTR